MAAVATTAGTRDGSSEQLYTERASGRRRRRLAAWKALSYLRVFSSLDRVKKCRSAPANGGPIEIRHRPEDGRAHYSGLQTCGSIHGCPLCSEKILAVRTDEILQAITTHIAKGGSVAMVTMTMRHRAGQWLQELWDGLGSAWTTALSGRRSRQLLAGVDWVKRVDCTHGRNGWHLHVHALLFLPAGRDDHDAIARSMFCGWATRLVALGLDAPLLEHGGLHVKALDMRRPAEEVADYLGKGYYEEAAPRRLAALELSSSGKLARGENRTPFQVLAALVADGRASDAKIWREWEKASHGRRAITWSRGARDRLCADPCERTDEALAQETDQGGTPVALLDAAVWRVAVCNPHLVAALLTRVETADDHEDAYGRLYGELALYGLQEGLSRPPPTIGEHQ
jgi:hypothetical protein